LSSFESPYVFIIRKFYFYCVLIFGRITTPLTKLGPLISNLGIILKATDTYRNPSTLFKIDTASEFKPTRLSIVELSIGIDNSLTPK